MHHGIVDGGRRDLSSCVEVLWYGSTKVPPWFRRSGPTRAAHWYPPRSTPRAVPVGHEKKRKKRKTDSRNVVLALGDRARLGTGEASRRTCRWSMGLRDLCRVGKEGQARSRSPNNTGHRIRRKGWSIAEPVAMYRESSAIASVRARRPGGQRP